MGRWAVPAVVVLAACPYTSKDRHDARLAALDHETDGGDEAERDDSDASEDFDPTNDSDSDHGASDSDDL